MVRVSVFFHTAVGISETKNAAVSLKRERISAWIAAVKVGMFVLNYRLAKREETWDFLRLMTSLRIDSSKICCDRCWGSGDVWFKVNHDEADRDICDSCNGKGWNDR